MRFDCGLTPEEKRKAQWQAWIEGERIFAWLPIRVGRRDCRWLEYVEKYREPLEGICETFERGSWLIYGNKPDARKFKYRAVSR